MDKKTEKKITDALYGIQVASEWPSISDHRIFESINPPGYMIKMVLQHLYGKRLPRGGDKSEWALPILYCEKIFTIEDFKRFKWNIYGKQNDKMLAKKLANKVISATKIFNNQIKKIAKESFDNDDFSLQNNYYKARNIFEFFSEQVKVLLAKKSKPKLKEDPSFVDILSTEIERRRLLEFYTIATSVFFFSLTETIFDSIFALSDRKETKYSEFRKLDWDERFKLLIPLDNKVKKLYDELIIIRKFYRNIPVHSSPEYFFSYKDFGLIPSNFEVFSDPHMKTTLEFSVDESKRIIDCFDKFLVLLKNHPATVYGNLYAEYDLPIFISKTPIDKLRKHMVSIEVFEKELEIRSGYQDALDNMDV